MELIKRVFTQKTMRSIINGEKLFIGEYIPYPVTHSKEKINMANATAAPISIRIQRKEVENGVYTFFSTNEDEFDRPVFNYKNPLFSYGQQENMFSCIQENVFIPTNPDLYKIGRTADEVKTDFLNDILSRLATILFQRDGSFDENEIKELKNWKNPFIPQEYIFNKSVCHCLLYSHRHPNNGFFDFISDPNEVMFFMYDIDIGAIISIKPIIESMIVQYEFSSDKQSYVFRNINIFANAIQEIVPASMIYMHDIYNKSRGIWEKATNLERDIYSKIANALDEKKTDVVIAKTEDGDILYPNATSFLENLFPQKLMIHYVSKHGKTMVPIKKVKEIIHGNSVVYQRP